MKNLGTILSSAVFTVALATSPLAASQGNPVVDVTPDHWQKVAEASCGEGSCGEGSCGSEKKPDDEKKPDEQKKPTPKPEGGEATCGSGSCG